ncbi:phenylalanine--tRNA ligase subunit beta [Clostridium sediminicola]|uniref:phenylalanine--tRNA ligase subunit beta n=1 Tax=Clostridium sediminicola TaxID=3114879 RepID=UPI0031F203AE
MKVPVKWLKDYVNIDVTPEELSDALTLSGSKAEEIIVSGADINKVVTGKLKKIEQHPDAEKLSVCYVDIAKEELLQIVTGATNMKEEDVVPVALHGSTLADGTKIKKGKLRGIVSNGMFCSKEELGIANDEPVLGLMILPEDTPLGVDIKKVVEVESAVIDFEITSNRPDCMSIIGMARETAATYGTVYQLPSLNYTEKIKEDINDILKVQIKDKLCRRYMAKRLKNVKIEPSPKWMQERLIEADVRPINNIVDITNFVMLELGQPMHAFDRRQITSNIINIERAVDGEKFTTLDGEERTLDSTILNIKDGDRTIALAGIMGGLNSEVKDDTTEIIFELANFDGTNIRLSSKKIGLRTDASSKFEKDIDPNLAEIALNRACNLVEELGAGEITEGVIDVYPEFIEPHIVTVNAQWVNDFIGINISKDEMKEYLNRLDLITRIEGENLIVNVPTFRCDINIREDVAEEIARIYGYNKIPSTIPSLEALKAGKSKKQKLEDILIDVLIGSGVNQSIAYSFVSPKVFDKVLIAQDSKLRNAVKIRNPLGEDYSIMRTTSIPSMMESLGRNYSRNNEQASLFEIGKVYLPYEDENEKLPEERNVLTLGLYGGVDYYDLKGIIENVISKLGVKKVQFERESNNGSYHPGKTAAIYVGKKYLGVVGEVHPDVSENYGIDENCYIAELNIDVLFNNANMERKYSALPKFPAVTRDLAILIDKEVLVKQIEEVMWKQGGRILESIKLFDVYEGKQIPEGKKSIAYSLKYRVPDKTLTDKDVNKIQNKIIRTLEYNLGAELR